MSQLIGDHALGLCRAPRDNLYCKRHYFNEAEWNRIATQPLARGFLITGSYTQQQLLVH